MLLTWIKIDTAHLAGDGSFREKKSSEFCQFRLNLLIKISYISNFFDPGVQNIFLFITWPFFVFEKIFILTIPPKLAKIIGVC